MTEQGELFPYARPETVLAYCRRLEAMVLTIAPELTREQCLRLLGELSLTTALAEKISVDIRLSAAWQTRQALPAIALQEETPNDRLEDARHWKRAHPVKYQPTPPPWPDKGFPLRRPRA